jgi:hypothetical protein
MAYEVPEGVRPTHRKTTGGRKFLRDRKSHDKV